jgi:hypothetical protein
VSQFGHHVEHLVDHFRVESRGGLVEQHADRIHGQCPGNRHALLLTAGQLTGELVGLRLEADPLEQLEALLYRLVLLRPAP